MKIIDAWIQHPTPRLMAHPMMDSLKRWMGMDPDAELPDMPLEMTLSMLDMAKIDAALVTAWYGPRGALISNDDVASFVAEAPDRLFGVASVNLHKPMDAVRELRRAVQELGFVGLRLLPWLWGLPPDDRRYYPLYATCVDLNIPFCLQVGHTGPMRSSEYGRPIPYLDNVALDFPELTIVGGHIGFPWTLEMISLARKYPNVYIDTSAYKPKRYPPELVDYMRHSGCKKVLWASNYPMIMPDDALGGIEKLNLDQAAEARFLHGNAAQVFGLATSQA